jgi:ABC-2 type transport system permease protein
MTTVHTPLVYDSSKRGVPAIEEVKEVFNFRNLIFQLARRDILARYKRSFLGVIWTMLNPLGMMLVLTIAFSHMIKVETVHGYPAYVLSGLMAWNFFSQTTTASMVNLVWGGGLLHRIYIPRTSFALAAIATGLINLILGIVPMIIVMLITQVPIHLSILALPVAMLLLASFSLGLGLIISTIAAYFPDVAEMYQILLTAWMYLTPIIYPESFLPDQYRYLVTHINPMYYLVKMYRLLIYDGRMPTLEEFLPALAISLITLVIGWIIFSNKSDEFAYRI